MWRDLPLSEGVRHGRLSFCHRHWLAFTELMHLHPRCEELLRQRRHVGLGAPYRNAAAIVTTAVDGMVTAAPRYLLITIQSFITMKWN